MKYLLYSDVHWSVKHSLVQGNSDKYSLRLTNLINSVNWAEEVAEEQNCDAVICLGDFFDSDTLCSEEITALSEINWSKLPHYFLVGNHETDVYDLSYNTVNIFQKNDFQIIKDVQKLDLQSDISLLFLPYIKDEYRKTIKDYKQDLNINSKKCIVLSHNDVKDIQYGAYISKSGIEVSDIEENCALFLNGHIHNGDKFCKNGINLGNLSGKAFTENAFKYSHCAYILDINETTLSMDLQLIENPYAFNFYQIDIMEEKDIIRLNNLKNNAVVIIRCVPEYISKVRDIVSKNKNIVKERIISLITMQNIKKVNTEEDLKLLKLRNNKSHLEQLVEFVKQTIGDNDLVNCELQKIIN